MSERLRRLLDDPSARPLLIAAAVALLGIIGTLRALVEAGQRAGDTGLDTADRIVLGLFDAPLLPAAFFLVGAAGVALLGGGHVPPPARAVLAGFAWAHVALAGAVALASLDIALVGSIGSGDDAIEMSGSRRLAGLGEGLGAGLAVAVGALAVARELLAPTRTRVGLAAATAEGDDGEERDALEDDVEEDEAPPELALALAPTRRLGPAPAPTPVEVAAVLAVPTDLRRWAPPGAVVAATTSSNGAGARMSLPVAGEEVAIARLRALYADRLRWSPHAAEARTLLARLEADPSQSDARSRLAELAEADGA